MHIIADGPSFVIDKFTEFLEFSGYLPLGVVWPGSYGIKHFPNLKFSVKLFDWLSWVQIYITSRPGLEVIKLYSNLKLQSQALWLAKLNSDLWLIHSYCMILRSEQNFISSNPGPDLLVCSWIYNFAMCDSPVVCGCMWFLTAFPIISSSRYWFLRTSNCFYNF